MEHKTYTLNDGREINIRSIIPNDSEQIINFYSSLSDGALKWITPLTSAEIEQRFRYPDYFIGLVTVHDRQVVGYGEISKDVKMYDGELNIHIHQNYQVKVLLLLLKFSIIPLYLRN